MASLPHPNYKRFSNTVFFILALLILIDFTFFATKQSSDIVSVKKSQERYYNAGRNHHYAYKLETPSDTFFVSETFAKSKWQNQRIRFSISPIFKEINWYQLETVAQKSFHSLRLISGLVLPLIVILALWISIKSSWDLTMFLLILKILIIGDLIFLML